MTRINVVPVEELVQEHLVAEYRELPRLYKAVLKAQLSGKTPESYSKTMPSQYKLGSGHVTFFYNKLKYIMNRHQQLIDEMLRRNYKPNFTEMPMDIISQLDSHWLGDYTPTKNAFDINRERIALRLRESQEKKNNKK